VSAARARRRAALAGVAAAAALAAATTPARAAASTPAATRDAAAASGAAGSAALTISASASAALKARHVTVSVTAPATRKGRAVTLPLSALDGSTLRLGGALRLRSRAHAVTLRSPRLALAGRARLSVLLAGRRTTIATTAHARVRRASGGLRLAAARLTLTAPAARTLARRLHVRALPRPLGTLRAAVHATPAAPTPTPTPTTPAPPGGCRLNTSGGTPPTPPSGEPPALPQPAGALSIAGATVSWHVRDSFIQYIAGGGDTSVSRGATSDPATVTPGSSLPLVYSFHFPLAGGWCDPATGDARLTFGGGLAFSYPAHGIDLVANDPELELAGGASRLIFRMTGGESTAGGNRRAVLMTLDPSHAAATSVSADGRTLTYTDIPAAIPPGPATSSTFAGFYLPGDPFGTVSITFTTT